MKILIAEDDVSIANALRDALETRGHIVQIVRDGARVVQTVCGVHFSVLILDVMLPNQDGFAICKELRKAQNPIPILMLTARDALGDRIRGLDAGADDYLVKPFAFGELEARLRVIMRRQALVRSREIQIADLVVDTATKSTSRLGRHIDLTAREYALLESLALAGGAILSKEHIIEQVFFESSASANTVEAHIKNLRRKIDDGFEQKLLRTVYGMGYSLRSEP